jgi:hypothetical protein
MKNMGRDKLYELVLSEDQDHYYYLIEKIVKALHRK